MSRNKAITPTHEMYLKVLYRLQQEARVARVRDVAAELGVNPGTVSGALTRLKQRGWIEQERYGFATLTEAGKRAAESVLYKFETLRDVLIEIFGVDPDIADEDACAMEHVVGPDTVGRMRATLEQYRAGKLRE
jgi:Mn-dependent DtxR family transcriptional regulator